MREKVMALAQGKFTYQEPEIVLSVDALKLDVAEGGEVTSVFSVRNSLGTKVKGFCAVDDVCFELLPVFDGKDNEITVKINAANKRSGDVLAGDIVIVTDCGETKLPYEVHVIGQYLEGGGTPLKTYDEFVEFAKESFDEAVPLFYHNRFSEIYLQELGEKRLYHNLISKNPKKQALEEFLIAHGDKKPVQFMVNKKQVSYQLAGEDVVDELIVAKSSWGMASIQVTSDSPYIVLDKSMLYARDFVNNRASISLHIAAKAVPAGMHQCRIVFKNVYQELELRVLIHVTEHAEDRKKKREEKRLIAAMVHRHIQYLMNSSLREQWLKLLIAGQDKILSLLGESDGFLLNGYISWLAKEERGQQAFLNAVDGMSQPETGESTEKVVRYACARYLTCKIRGSEEETEEVCRIILAYHQGGYRHWRLFVLLERLGYFQGNHTGMQEELDLLWEEGYSSPYQHFYQMMQILQEPNALKQLNSQMTEALLFGLKHDLITEDIVIALSFLAARKKKASPSLLVLLKGCYRMFENTDTLQSICTLLIRSEQLERRNFEWFRLGVEKRLRITELYEYYMYTLGRENVDEALPVVMSFFQYENHLRDSVKISFYASIVRNRDEHPEYFHKYSSTIREFVLKQLYERRVNPELAVLYETFLSPDNTKDRIAKELPYILFTHHVRCSNKKMERVVVVHDEGGGEIVYNLAGGEADILIGTPNYRLYFVDKNGFYHGSTVSYEIRKILNLDIMAEGCYENGSEHPVLLLHLFSRALEKEEIGAKDALILHTMIRNQVPGVEYKRKALLALYEYYKAIGEDSLLEEVIRRFEFKYLSPERRAGILQTMIQHKMNDEALAVLRKYEITGGSSKLLLLLISWKLEESEGEFEPYYMRLCSFLYKRGVKNKTTLTYLTNYFMGSTEELLTIYNDAVRQEAEISDGATERLLGQALFVSDEPQRYSDIFLDYFEYGANRILVKAFLGYTAYEFLLGRTKLTEGMLEKIQKEGLSEENHIMILAMLRYYTSQKEYTEAEKEYVEYHLFRYASTGRIFSFMKEFIGKVEVPFAIEYADIIEFRSSHRGDVYIEIEDEQKEKIIQPMSRIFDDIYIYETLLFQGEVLRYRIFAGDMDKPAKSGELVKEGIEERQDMAFYEMVNRMIAAKDSGDKEGFDALVEKYKSRRQIAGRLFTPL